MANRKRGCFGPLRRRYPIFLGSIEQRFYRDLLRTNGHHKAFQNRPGCSTLTFLQSNPLMLSWQDGILGDPFLDYRRHITGCEPCHCPFECRTYHHQRYRSRHRNTRQRQWTEWHKLARGLSLVPQAGQIAIPIATGSPKRQMAKASTPAGFLKGQRSRTRYNTSGACTAVKADLSCPLWVISRRNDAYGQCPLFPQEQTSRVCNSTGPDSAPVWCWTNGCCCSSPLPAPR